MKNGCDGIPVGAWQGSGEEGIAMLWDLTYGAETWAARTEQNNSDVAEIMRFEMDVWCHKYEGNK